MLSVAGTHWQEKSCVIIASPGEKSGLAIVDGSDEQSFEKPRRYGVTLRYNY